MGFNADVFSKQVMPGTSNEFFDSYKEIFGGEEERDYDSLKGTDPVLAKWFKEMIERFPALNGEYADWDEEEIDEEKEKYLVDYCIGSEYISFSSPWTIAEELQQIALELAKKHDIGYHDSVTGILWAPGMEILYIKTEKSIEYASCWTYVERDLDEFIAKEGIDHFIELRIAKPSENDLKTDRLRIVPSLPKSSLFSKIFGGKKSKNYHLEIYVGGDLHLVNIADEKELKTQIKNFCYGGKIVVNKGCQAF